MHENELSIDEIFFAALERTADGERAAYLDVVCANDATLRQRVDRLLHAQSKVTSFLESPAPGLGLDTNVDPSDSEQAGEQIGPYKLLEQIGEGGFGVVFMAEQIEPVRRKVALKIIKPGMDTKQVIARFEAERQALALMDHPNIARVFDGGATESGRPYFVMELVHGVPITEYCNLKKLTPPERSRLFIDVCRAVQHAHQKGIIHRDLKSSNVMVTMHDEKPVPKIIDFGVSKAISHQLTEKTLFTAYGQMVGTPMYMSPEQAQLSGLDVDTRSDVYSLGVLLYELTTGTTPFDEATFRRVGFDEMRRMIREDEPLCPSARINTLNADQLSTVADQRNVDPRKLCQSLRGEVDWIVMKCLEKDRNRRYETANALAQDIERSLSDEPVQACPPSATYRLRKFARRNKRALAAAILMTTALLLVVGSFAWTLRDRAARQFLLEQQVTRALVESKDSYERDRMPEALATMNRAEGLLASAGGGTKLLRDRVRRWRSDLDMAVRFEEIRLNRAAVRDESFDAAGAILAYREAFCDYGLDIDQLQVQEAAERIRASAVKAHLIAALDDWLPSVATTDPTWNRLLTIARLADSDPWRNRFRAAREEALHRRDISPVVKLARDKEVLNQSAITLQLLGQVLRANGENSLAVNVLRQSQQRRPDDFWINHTLAQALERMKPPQTDEAIAFFRVAVALRPESPGAILNLGRALAQQGKMDEAIAAYRRAIDLKPDYATPYNHLGAAFMDQNKFDEAAAAHRKAISLRPDLAAGHLHLGCVLQRQGKLDEAISELRRAIELQPDSAAAYNHLGLALSEDGKLDEGISALRKAAELQPDSETYNGLGAALAVQGKLDEAIAALRKAIELKPDDDRPYQTLGMVLTAQGRSDEAIAAFRKVIELKPDHALGYNGLGTMLQDQGKLDEAAAALRKAIELRPQYAEAYNNLGVVLSGQGKPDEAIAAYRKAIELQPDAAAAYSNLAIKLRDQGKWDEALELATKAVSLQPQNSMNWHALGWACYRTGDWQASIEAMEKSCKLHVNGIGDASQWLCLAMAHWQLGRHDEARTWYDKAVQNESAWPDVLRRLRTEAEELFGEKDENKSSKAQ